MAGKVIRGPDLPSTRLVNSTIRVREPSVKELRDAFSPESKQRSHIMGLILPLIPATVCAIAFAGVLGTAHPSLKVLLGILLGIGISALFVIGHDACHDSLTPSHRLNQILGRLCFLPTLHPYVCWELGHDRFHHGSTNLKGVDYVYTSLFFPGVSWITPLETYAGTCLPDRTWDWGVLPD